MSEGSSTHRERREEGEERRLDALYFFQGLFIILVHGEPICNRLPLHMWCHITNAALGKGRRESEESECLPLLLPLRLTIRW